MSPDTYGEGPVRVIVAGVGMIPFAKPGPTQVEGARHALQHNLGPRGACVVTMYERI